MASKKSLVLAESRSRAGCPLSLAPGRPSSSCPRGYRLHRAYSRNLRNRAPVRRLSWQARPRELRRRSGGSGQVASVQARSLQPWASSVRRRQFHGFFESLGGLLSAGPRQPANWPATRRYCQVASVARGRTGESAADFSSTLIASRSDISASWSRPWCVRRNAHRR